MKPKEFTLDASDIKGKFFPGMIILVNLVLLHKYLLNDMDLLKIYKDYQVIVIVLILIIAYVLGDINSFLSFRIRGLYGFFVRKSETLENFLNKKILKDKLIECFKNDFGEKSLKINYWKFHFICRETFIDANPEGYKHTEKVSTRVRFNVGMILPSLFTGINIFINPEFNNILGFFCIIISIIFFIGAEEKKKEEAYVIFLNYYNLHKNKNAHTPNTR